MNKPKNVKIITSEYLIYFPKVQESKFFSFINYFLRLHYDLKSLDPSNYNWLPPESLLLGPEQGLDDQFVQSVCDDLEKESVDIDKLYSQIGQMKVEIDFLKKKLY